MERSVYDLTLDMQQNHAFREITVKKGDTHRRLQIRLLSGGSLYPVTDDCYGVFTAQKPDGTVLYNRCSREGDQFVYDLTSQTTATPGVLSCELRLYGPEDALLTTATFTLNVEDTVYTEGEEAVTSTGEATALTQLITQARAGICEMEKVLQNEVNHAVIDDTKAGVDAWSSKNIVDKLCPVFTESGAVVQCEPVEGYPLRVVSRIEPVQSGSGDPSPDNIRPITGRANMKLFRHGKNFIKFPYYHDSQTINGVTFTVNADGTVTANGTSTEKSVFALSTNSLVDGLYLPVGKFTLSGCPAGGSHATYRMAAIGNGYGLDAYDLGSGATGIVKEGRPCTGVRIEVMKAGITLNNVVFKPQIEIGSVATEYEPYQGNTFTLDLGQTVYGGSLDWKTGVLTIDRGVFDLGDFEWKFCYDIPDPDDGGPCAAVYTEDLVGIGHDWEDDIGPDDPEGDPDCMCSHYPVMSAMEIYQITDTRGIGYDSTTLYVSNVRYAGTPIQDVVEDLKGVQFSVPLKNPITVQLTPQEVLALSGANTLISDCGDTTVIGRADPVATIDKLTNAIIALGGNV